MGGMGGMGEGKPADTSKFYDILDIQKDASAGDIKKAYRKLAMKHHPDKGGDTEKFKEISKAYEVLKDDEKRQLYDKYGEQGLEQGGGGGGGMDIFSQFFGGAGGGGGRPRGPRKGKDVLFKLKVTYAEFYAGACKKLRLSKQVLCNGCDGKGGKSEAVCNSCKGRGVKMRIRQLGPGMIQQMQVACEVCNGQGKSIPEKDKCKQCDGAKTHKTKKTLEVFIEKGMKKGTKIVFKNESDQLPDIVPGDVIVVLEEEEHKLFKREGSHLFLKKKISLTEALIGFEFSVQHLDGTYLKVKSNNEVISPHQVLVVRDQGMPYEKNPSIHGHLYIEFDVEFPKSQQLSNPMKKKIKSFMTPLFDEKAEDDIEMSDADDVMLEHCDMDIEKRKWAQEARETRGRGEAYDDDDEDEEQGASCRAQ